MLAKDVQASIDWVARARALAPTIEAAGDRIEQERRIAPEVLAALHDAGLFRMLLPVSLGGGAADIVTFNQVIESIAAADASTGWCLAQAVASSHAAGFLDPKIAREVFGARQRRRLGAAGRARQGDRRRRRLYRHRPMAVRQRQRAMPVDGRPFDRVRARRQAAPRRARPAGQPHHAVPQGEGDDPRHLARGRTARHASNDYEVRDLFVPEPYTTWRDLPADRREQGPLYNIPLLTLYGIGFSGVALGIARASLDAFMTLAATKKTGRRRSARRRCCATTP